MKLSSLSSRLTVYWIVGFAVAYFTLPIVVHLLLAGLRLNEFSDVNLQSWTTKRARFTVESALRKGPGGTSSSSGPTSCAPIWKPIRNFASRSSMRRRARSWRAPRRNWPPLSRRKASWTCSPFRFISRTIQTPTPAAGSARSTRRSERCVSSSTARTFTVTTCSIKFPMRSRGRTSSFIFQYAR